MNKIGFLICSSLEKKLKSKWFMGINIVIFLLILATFHVGDFITLFGGSYKEVNHIVVLDEAGVYLKFEQLLLEEKNFDIEYQVSLSRESKETLLKRVEEEGSLIAIEILKDENNYLRGNIYSTSNVATVTKTVINNSLNQIKKELAIASLGLNEKDIDSINLGVVTNYQILQSSTNEYKEDDSNVVMSIIVVVFIMISFLVIINLVQMIGAEINEEKKNKTMEIIISDVPPKAHFISKLVSCTLFILIQVFLFVVYGIIASSIKGPQGAYQSSFIHKILVSVITPSMMERIVSVLPILLLFFFITLLSYAMLSAVLASVTTNIDDFQQLQTPIMLTVSFGLYLSIFAMIFEGSFFVKFMSYVPMFSFMLSPTLYFLNQISLGSLIVSMGIQFVFACFIYQYGLRIYKMGILNYSSDHLWKKIVHALKKR